MYDLTFPVEGGPSEPDDCGRGCHTINMCCLGRFRERECLQVRQWIELTSMQNAFRNDPLCLSPQIAAQDFRKNHQRRGFLGSWVFYGGDDSAAVHDSRRKAAATQLMKHAESPNEFIIRAIY